MPNSKSSRRMIVAGNWKMYKTRAQAVELATQIVQAMEEEQKKANHKSNMLQVFLFPPFTSLEYVCTAVKGSGILVGAQNMNQHESGGYTGEISADMIIDCGASAVLIGHSERRHIFHEADAEVHAKLTAALKHKLIPLLCIGETLEQRDADQTDMVIQGQISAALKDVHFPDHNYLIVAYEPVWAIGTGKVCDPAEANRVTGIIRDMLRHDKSTQSFAELVPILYGGSVKPDNVVSQLAQDNIDGALVGGASLTAAEFVPIIEAGVRS